MGFPGCIMELIVACMRCLSPLDTTKMRARRIEVVEDQPTALQAARRCVTLSIPPASSANR